jgi:acyl carrier protein
MPEPGTVEGQIRDFIANLLKIEGSFIKLTADFASELGIDSQNKMNIIIFLEDEFKIKVPDEEAVKITSLQKAIDYVMEKSQPE